MRSTRKCGIYVPAIAKARESGIAITPAWLMQHCGISRRQADNALNYATRIGLIRSRDRGVYEPAPAA